MILKEIVNNTSWDELTKTICFKTTEHKYRKGYKIVFKRLKQLEPKKNNMVIHVEFIQTEDEDFFSVFGKNGDIDEPFNEEAEWGLFGMSWEEWLGMNINIESLKKNSQSEILAVCIDEMTWFGYSSNEVRRNARRMFQEDQKIPLIFISHANEDKDDLVRPLTKELENIGLSIWQDESELKIGDSLGEKISEAIAKSDYGIVVFSQNFFNKRWTEYELNVLITNELAKNIKILPIWHNLSFAEILSYDPSIADKFALSTKEFNIKQIALKIEERIMSDKKDGKE